MLFQLPLRIAGTPENPENKVIVNDITIASDGSAQTILTFIAAFLAFNLHHHARQEATIEALEALLGIRKSFSRQGPKNFIKCIGF